MIVSQNLTTQWEDKVGLRNAPKIKLGWSKTKRISRPLPKHIDWPAVFLRCVYLRNKFIFECKKLSWVIIYLSASIKHIWREKWFLRIWTNLVLLPGHETLAVPLNSVQEKQDSPPMWGSHSKIELDGFPSSFIFSPDPFLWNECSLSCGAYFHHSRWTITRELG